MVEDIKNPEISAEDVIASIKDAAPQDAVDDIMELTETEMVSNAEKTNEELIDIKSFDETGELNAADEQSQLAAKAQHGDDDAIAAFSQTLKDEEPAGQDGVDALLDNIGQVAETATEEVATQEPVEQPVKDELSAKAEMLESASKTYAEKDFSASAENIDENADVASTEEVLEKPTEASMDDIAAAMQSVAPELAEPKVNLANELANKVTERVALKAVPAVSGLQVGFPIEVLAEALRPMVADWVEENLPSIVEKLVKEELSKLADQ